MPVSGLTQSRAQNCAHNRIGAHPCAHNRLRRSTPTAAHWTQSLLRAYGSLRVAAGRQRVVGALAGASGGVGGVSESSQLFASVAAPAEHVGEH